MKNDTGSKHLLSISGKKVTLYPASAPDRPAIYLNTFSEEDGRVYHALRDTGCPDFTLTTISGLVWEHDMAPWDAPPVSKNSAPCTGGADDYLRLLEDEIIPAAEKFIPGRILWRGLAGYSLAGLFALYSLYHTELFSRIASLSGSLWFPGFRDYALSHEMKRPPEHLYLSLGDRECKTSHPYLKTVQTHTEALCAFYTSKGIDTKFQLNPGNHYKNIVQRTVSGIIWLLKK